MVLLYRQGVESGQKDYVGVVDVKEERAETPDLCDEQMTDDSVASGVTATSSFFVEARFLEEICTIDKNRHPLTIVVLAKPTSQ